MFGYLHLPSSSLSLTKSLLVLVKEGPQLIKSTIFLATWARRSMEMGCDGGLELPFRKASDLCWILLRWRRRWWWWWWPGRVKKGQATTTTASSSSSSSSSSTSSFLTFSFFLPFSLFSSSVYSKLMLFLSFHDFFVARAASVCWDWKGPIGHRKSFGHCRSRAKAIAAASSFSPLLLLLPLRSFFRPALHWKLSKGGPEDNHFGCPATRGKSVPSAVLTQLPLLLLLLLLQLLPPAPSYIYYYNCYHY